MASRANGLTLHGCPSADVPAMLADRLVQAVADGGSVLVTGAASPSPLFAAAARHPRLLGTRVFRVGPPLDLIAMLRQVTAGDGPTDATLEEGFDALTAPSAGCSRIVLFVEDAHLLPHATLRYIEFALRAGPHLQVVLAGQSGIEEMLALDGFAGLRSKIPLHLTLPDPVPEHASHPSDDPLPWEPGLVAPHRMTPPRLLAGAAVAAGLAIAGMMSLAPPAPPAMIASDGFGAAPRAAAAGPPEQASTQEAPAPAARPVLEPDTSVAAALPGPGAAPPSSPPDEAGPSLAADMAATPETVAANAPDFPPAASVPASIPEADLPSGVPGQPGTAMAADAPSAPQAAESDMRDLRQASTPEAAPEVAEAAALPEVQPAAAVPGQDETMDPGPSPAPALGTPPAVGPAAGPDAAAGMAAPPLAAQLTVPMPVTRPARTAVLPAAPRPPARSAAIRPERVADRIPAPGGDGQRCRGIILRLQLGETPTDGDRTFLRNGCR